MKKFYSFILFFSYITVYATYHDTCALTYELNGGRLGDNILAYVVAKFLAYKYNLTLLYVPFPYSEFLALSQLEKKLQETDLSNFKNKIEIKNDSILCDLLKKKENVLFISKFSTAIKFKNKFSNLENLFLETIQDKIFGAEIKKMLFTPTKKFELPQDKITVAVHIRHGGGWDQPLSSQQFFAESELYTNYTIVNTTNLSRYTTETSKILSCDKYQKLSNKTPEILYVHTFQKPSDVSFPTKFPPHQYYVDQIKKLSDILGDAPMFVYLFTDYPYPQDLLEEISKYVNKSNIVFATRTGKNSYNINVLEDCYAMAQFDCLIRSCSHFPWISQLMGNHKIIISPHHATWIDQEKLVMDRVNIFLRKPDNNNYWDFLFNQIVIRTGLKADTL